MSQYPQFLVEWPSPWREFLSSLGPALRPSPPRLRMETRAGLFPGREMLLIVLVEVAALAAVAARPKLIPQPVTAELTPAPPEVIYFSADELPRTEDMPGASAGQHGASGGASLHHPTQTIKVSRGEKVDARVADAPALNLPQSESQLSNLLAYKANLPTAPAAPIVVRADQRKIAEQAAAPKLSLSRNNLPKLPEATVTPVAPPPVIRVSHERAKLEMPSPVAPSVPVSTEQMPNLPQANVVVKAPAMPIQVARTQRKAALELATPSVPNVTMAREKMPDLPNATIAVKAPPTPIQVARGQRRTTTATSVSVPKINAVGTRSGEQLAGVLSAPVSAPVAPQKPVQQATQGDSKVAAVVISSNPGSTVGIPKEQAKTTVAMEVGGTKTPGSGGTDGGAGMRVGKGPGNSVGGQSAGASPVANDRGADLYARNGNSPNLGPGGTGNLNNAAPHAPGVSISGGKNSITLPSFGGPPSPANSGRSETAKNMGTGITVVASPRAGGALNLYGALKGDRVYTIYINTRIGTAIMQFADPNSVGRGYVTTLTAPQVLRANVADQATVRGRLPKVLISCNVDDRGEINNARVLQSENNDFAAKVLAALPLWKFTPAYRGNQPVAVNAIVGFGVDTN